MASGVDSSDARLPSLIVFDLDHTLWTPELYKLRSLKGYADASGPGPIAGKDVRLFKDAEAILTELATEMSLRDDGGGGGGGRWSATQLAVASRTNKGAWARKLLGQFSVSVVGGASSSSSSSTGNGVTDSGGDGGDGGSGEVASSRTRKVTLDELLPHKQIVVGSKEQHFNALRRDTGVEFGDMLFFDDARDGKFGNCERVAKVSL